MKKKTCLPIAGLIFLVFLVFPDGIVFGQAQSPAGWSEPINVSRSGSASSPLIVIDSNGVHHSIWIDSIDDAYMYSNSTDGVAWSAPVSVSFPFTTIAPAPKIFPASNGTIYVFWQVLDSTQENYILRYGNVSINNFDDPGSWNISELALSVTDYDVHIDDQGVVAVAYIKNLNSDTNPSGVYYRYFVPNGTSWSQAHLLHGSEYLRSTFVGDAHVSISSVVNEDGKQVYVAWDDKFQKGIYMTKSFDGGTTWGPVNRVRGSEDELGRAAPYNVEVASFQDKVLLTWQVGEPDASRCSIYSQWSTDGGNKWDEPLKVLDDIFDCPKVVKFISITNDFFVISLETGTEFSLIAWNNYRWSRQQLQSDTLNLVNPLTRDAIQFGCLETILFQGKLHVVGCDTRRGGDVWYASRQFDNVGAWFLPPAEWDAPDIFASTRQSISSPFFVSDDLNNIHAFWVQSPSSVYDESSASIYYARWNGKQWLFDVSILGGLSGLPTQLSAGIDTDGRMFLVWVDANNGDLLYSWAYADKANIPTEWLTPQRLPSLSQWASAPDILIDATGKLVVAYAVPLNDARGIYIVESSDAGQNWSLPIKVVDAISEGWNLVDNPEIALDSGGVLHVLFGKYDISKIDQSKGLYYTRSSDGGVSWSNSQLIIERPILWSELVSYDVNKVHLFWQEHNNSVFANRNQISGDSGESWDAPFDVTSVKDKVTQTVLVMDRSGVLHFFQLVDIDSPILLNWEWNGTDWVQEETIQLNDKYHGGHFSLASGVTSENYLNVSVAVEYVDINDQLNSELLSFSRYVGVVQSDTGTSLPSIAPTPVPSLTVTPVISLTELSSTDVPFFDEQPVSSSLAIRNIIGLILIGAAIFAIFIVIRRRNK